MRDKLAWLKRQADEWGARYYQMVMTSKRLQKARTGIWPLFGRKEHRQAAQTAFFLAVTSCREICPKHPDLEGIEKLAGGQ